ncbi:MAG: DUF4430 domain-containing protein [Promethearchaeota archaeon]
MWKKKVIISSIIGVTFIAFLISSIFLFPKTPIYSWKNDPNRLDFPETVSNISLIVNYGAENGTTDIFEGINLTNHYTSVFDLLNKCCIIKYRIYWQDSPIFYISSINYLSETSSNGWRYSINDDFPPIGCNLISPPDNSIIRWGFTK